MRIEPPPSLPVHAGNIPDATAAAEPPDDPPGVASGFHGLRVMPCSGELVKLGMPNSGAVVSPTITAPAARSRATSVQSTAATWSAVQHRRVGVREALRLRELLHAHRHAGERAGVAAVARPAASISVGRARARRRRRGSRPRSGRRCAPRCARARRRAARPPTARPRAPRRPAPTRRAPTDRSLRRSPRFVAISSRDLLQLRERVLERRRRAPRRPATASAST